MALRTNYFDLASEAMTLLMQQEDYLSRQFSASVTVTSVTWELVKLRISQINQCAFCIDMHTKEALGQGESPERIIGLNAWRDMPLYTEKENAALEWAEHLTISKAVDSKLYHQAVDMLGEQGVVDLTLAINAINSWNRVAKTFTPEVGSYKSE